MPEARERKLTFAVMGTGGVGGYYGGRLAAVGAEVAFVARGPHLEAIRDRGLRVLSPLGDILVRPILATENPAEIGPVDVVLFAVKLYDTETAAAAVTPMIGAETVVVSLQNGVDESTGPIPSLLPDRNGLPACVGDGVVAPRRTCHRRLHLTRE